jgi:manganese oxidase
VTRLLAFLLAASLGGPAGSAIVNNDNTRPAGSLNGDVLTLRMVSDVGDWRPSGAHGNALKIAAFAEEGSDFSAPGPLIRVPQGTTVALTMRNALTSELRLFGLCTRPGNCEPISIPSGGSREVRFALNEAGTFYYWGSTGASTLPVRTRPDSQLGGAIVVDAPGASTRDRIFVISTYDAPRPMSDEPRKLQVADAEPRVFAVNGGSWPDTERLRHQVGEAVRWRVVNLSNIGHAMHLHGFHFDLEAVGNLTTDRQLTSEQRRTEVTEFVGPGRTFAMSWTPTRPGNWLFHCHMTEHMSLPGHAGHPKERDDHAAGMAGLVLGIEVAGPAGAAPSLKTARKLALVLREEPNRYGDSAGFRMDITGADAPRLDSGPVPGPLLVLQRGEPVEIEVVNRMSTPTAMHWHGIELDSYFDGVPGYGGQGSELAPAIAAGGTFVAKFTPPRAGTFIYHTHWHDEAQLAGGLYGALLVLEPGEKYDPSIDHVVIIGLNGTVAEGQREPFALNGRHAPAPIRMRVGVPNRLRLINITANNDVLTAFLMDQFEPSTWNPVAKDGAALPADQSKPRAARQLVSVGETYDFDFHPTRPQNLWLEIRRGNGEWVLQAPVIVR